MAMKYSSRRYKKKTSNKKKSTYRKKYPIVNTKNKIHSFTRTAILTSPNMTATTTATGGNIGFTLSQVPNYTEYTALFDQYRIKAVKISIIPELTQGTLNSGAINAGSIWTTIDHTDLASPANVDEILQYDKLKRGRTTSIHTRYVRVNTIEDNMVDYNKWHSTADSNEQYYGVKFWREALGSGTLPTKLIVKYYLQFKDQK